MNAKDIDDHAKLPRRHVSLPSVLCCFYIVSVLGILGGPQSLLGMLMIQGLRLRGSKGPAPEKKRDDQNTTDRNHKPNRLRRHCSTCLRGDFFYVLHGTAWWVTVWQLAFALVESKTLLVQALFTLASVATVGVAADAPLEVLDWSRETWLTRRAKKNELLVLLPKKDKEARKAAKVAAVIVYPLCIGAIVLVFLVTGPMF